LSSAGQFSRGRLDFAVESLMLRNQMPTIAYFANIFPSAVEPYVIEEIQALRNRGVTVIPCSALRTNVDRAGNLAAWAGETFSLEPLQFGLLLRAGLWCVWKCARLKGLCSRALRRQRPTERRLPALLHTLLGVYYALWLGKQHVEHIHVHHGYFGSWIAMVAAHLLDIPFSMTLHGSDVLIHAAYLDIKLEQCQFCVTISEFSRRHILESYPDVNPAKIYVRRMGVDCGVSAAEPRPPASEPLIMLAVGRLHAVKDHAFLVRACRVLKDLGQRFVCLIAGDGPERGPLERLIRDLRLEQEIKLLGQLGRHEVDYQYHNADLVVLTSRSEGIPLVLMEAMARGKVVLAPAITGIPELVVDGQTGFLYQPGSLADFVARVELINGARSALAALRGNAREHVIEHFSHEKNLAAFCELFLENLRPQPARISIPA
jgi:glycosyltransferase involved in cell wall biosynthesis